MPATRAGSTGRRQLIPKEHKVKYIQASASSGSEIELLPRVRHGLRVRFCMRENKRTQVRQVLRAVETHRPLKHSAGKGAVQRLGCHVAGTRGVPRALDHALRDDECLLLGQAAPAAAS